MTVTNLRSIPSRTLILCLLGTSVLVSALYSGFAHSQASDNLVESIMSLRSDVEQLYTQVQDGKDDHRAQMRSYTAQKADLEAQINRQEIALQQLQIEIEKTRSDIDRVSARGESLSPVLTEGLVRLRDLVASGLPFKLPERLADLDKLADQISDRSITDERALGVLWAAYEDVFRLSRENGLFKQEIELDGQAVLADVAKLGSVMLLFSTGEASVGYAARTESGVEYRLAQTTQEQQQIQAVFDAFRKQIRTGVFQLPSHFVFSEVAL